MKVALSIVLTEIFHFPNLNYSGPGLGPPPSHGPPHGHGLPQGGHRGGHYGHGGPPHGNQGRLPFLLATHISLHDNLGIELCSCKRRDFNIIFLKIVLKGYN